MTARRNFPHALQDAFLARRRAIRVHNAQLETAVLLDRADARGRELERGETTLAFRVDGRGVLIRVHAWEDRWVWLDARHSSKAGWIWQFTAQGRLVKSPRTPAVISRVESMMRAAYLPPTEVPRAMAAIWVHCLAPGPARVY
jgi:hypothetical protein